MVTQKTFNQEMERKVRSKSNLRSLALRSAKRALGTLLAVSALAASSAYAQLPYSEDFTTTTYEDTAAGQTTADWNTVSGQLLLPVAPSLTGTTFDDTTTVEVLPGDFITRVLPLGIVQYG